MTHITCCIVIIFGVIYISINGSLKPQKTNSTGNSMNVYLFVTYIILLCVGNIIAFVSSINVRCTLDNSTPKLFFTDIPDIEIRKSDIYDQKYHTAKFRLLIYFVILMVFYVFFILNALMYGGWIKVLNYAYMVLSVLYRYKIKIYSVGNAPKYVERIGIGFTTKEEI